MEPPGSWLDETACLEMQVNAFLASYLMLITLSSQANALVEKQRTSLVEAHKHGCPWKTRQCDREFHHVDFFLALTQNEASIYRIPLQHPTATVKGLKAVAIFLPELLKDVIIKHPLVCGTSLRAPLSILQSITIRPKRR